MISLLFSIILYLCIAGFIWWAASSIINLLPIVEPIKSIVNILMIVLIVVIVFYALTPLIPMVAHGIKVGMLAAPLLA